MLLRSLTVSTELAPVLQDFRGELAQQLKSAKSQMLWAALASC
jgi:hypothetical protein|eukprot:COSAG02_NODE_3659_length_6408_cov_3.543192_3_plen_43_part_00